MTKKEEFYLLLKLYNEGGYETETFCGEMERILFFESNGISEFRGKERAAVEKLAKAVERYSPFEADLKKYPGVYIGDKDINKAVDEFCTLMNICRLPGRNDTMKKGKGWIIGSVAVLFIIGSFLYTQQSRRDFEDYIYGINRLIENHDFKNAEVEDNKIRLYDGDFNLISEIKFDDKGSDIIAIRKDGDRIFFVTGGAVDDDWGYVFINNDADSVMNGIRRLEWVGGNLYHYSTN